MMPDEVIDIEEDEYARATATVNDGALGVSSTVDIEGKDFDLGQGDSWSTIDEGDWCTYINASGINENDQHVNVSMSMSETVSMKLVESIAEMWDWEGDGYTRD